MKRKDLKDLYRAGLISSKPYEYFAIKDKFQQYKKQGMGVEKAVLKVAELTGKKRDSIYRAIRATKNIDLE